MMSLDPRIVHYRLLLHAGLGATELRVFAPSPRVGYVNNEADFVRLCRIAELYVPGLYVGVQPRPLNLFDLAPNRWVPAAGGPAGNCAKDTDIDYVSALYFDIDVHTPKKNAGHPASDAELEKTLATVRIQRFYKKDDDWKHTPVLFAEDLLAVALVAHEAYKYLRLRQNCEPNNNINPSKKEV